jgi:hypothetical protein
MTLLASSQPLLFPELYFKRFHSMEANLAQSQNDLGR